MMDHLVFFFFFLVGVVCFVCFLFFRFFSLFLHTMPATPLPYPKVASLSGKHVTCAGQFNRTDIDALITLAQQLRHHVESGETIDVLRGKVMTPLFYEDSSRTLSSFTCAMLRLGGQVVPFKVDGSSVSKGETLKDTVRCLDSYSDVMVLRHPQNSALEEAVQVAVHPIMNAGNGSGEHPSQALLDTFTIHEELGSVDGKTIALIGDLKMGRTVHSLLKLLSKNFKLNKVYLVSPELLRIPAEVLADVKTAAPNLAIEETVALTPKVVADCDVLYATRLQKERFSMDSSDTNALQAFETAKTNLLIDRARLKDAKEKMVVMHPLPRVDELSTDIDNDPRAAYFRQMRYGLFMRMAILYSVLA